MVGQVSGGFVPFREKQRQKGEKMAHPIGKLILSYLPVLSDDHSLISSRFKEVDV